MIRQADNRAVSVGSIYPLHGICGVQKTALTGGFLFLPLLGISPLYSSNFGF
jgi:hypothetical protein